MKKISYEIIKYFSFIFLVIGGAFLLRFFIFDTLFIDINSFVYVTFALGFALLLQMDYAVLKKGLYHKCPYLFLILFTIFFHFAFYFLYTTISSHLDTIGYIASSTIPWQEQLKNFLMAPFLLEYFNMKKILGMEVFFSLFCLLLSMIKTNKNAYFSYLVEELKRVVFHHTFLFTFTIILFSFPKAYPFIRELQGFVLMFWFLFSLFTMVRIFLSLYSCYQETKRKEKENLFLLVSDDNFDSYLSSSFVSILQKFRFAYSNRISNSLLMREGHNTFASYTAYRHHLIQREDYKNVYYLIFYHDRTLFAFDKKAKAIFLDTMNKISKTGSKYQIIARRKSKTSISLFFEKTYTYHYKTKFDKKKVLSDVMLEEENKQLKEKVKALLEKIEENDKNRYLISSFQKIINSYNPVEYLYSLLKVCEYVIHYRALSTLVKMGSVKAYDMELKNPTLGIWIKYQNVKKKYQDSNLTASITNIENIINKEQKETLKTTTTYINLCELVVKLRNRLFGHGVVTYAISQNIVNDFMNITEILVLEFLDFSVTVEEEDKIKGLFQENIKAIIKKEGGFYLYNHGFEGTKEPSLEYLDYKTGKLYIKNEESAIQLDL